MPPQPKSQSPWVKLGITAAVVAVSALFAFPLDKKLTLGLDLQGGTYMDLEVQLDEAVRSNSERALDGMRKELEDKGIKPEGAVQDRPGRLVISGIAADKKDAANDVLDQHAAAWDATWSGDTVTVQLKPAAIDEARRNASRQVKETIGRRINEFGVKEPLLATQGASGERIVLQLPGLSDADRVKRIITTASVMEFRLGKGQGFDTKEALVVAQGGALPENVEAVQGSASARTGTKWFVLDKLPVARGEDLIDARASSDKFGKPSISFTLSPAAGKQFGAFTGSHVGQPLAIVLDGKVIEYATIQSQIFSRGEITGGFNEQEAIDHSLTLRSGGLPAKVTILHEQTVGPSLGRDSIAAGSRASLYACIAIIAFMLLWYKGAGVNALVALILNMLIVLGAMAAMGATLTLPGIAGLVLTVGMAVDANVLVFERIREELAGGRSARAAVDAGFSRAFRTIFDSHVTALIAAFFLYNFGTGPIKGFAVTLALGLVASVFTSTYVSRAIFELTFSLREGATTISIQWRPWKAPNFAFMKLRYYFLGITWALCAASLAFWLIHGLSYGIDFRGGTEVVVKSAKAATAEDVRQRLAGTEFAGIMIQQFGTPTNHEFLLRLDDAEGAVSTANVNTGETAPAPQQRGVAQRLISVLAGPSAAEPGGAASIDLNAAGEATLADRLQSDAGLPEDQAKAAASALVAQRLAAGGQFTDMGAVTAMAGLPAAAVDWLRAHAHVGDFTVVSAESVGPAVGNELKGQAVRAVAWSLLGILIYVAVRFEFRFSLGAVAATVHDVIITIGFLVVLREPFDISVIAAVLTVVGFSLNDTIVVFDRIRETIKESRGMPFMEVIDRSINETLSRTMLTSGLTMLTVLALLIWGGPVLRGFSLALAIGVVVGTYSSIFVASPIVLMMERGRRRRVRAEARTS